MPNVDESVNIEQLADVQNVEQETTEPTESRVSAESKEEDYDTYDAPRSKDEEIPDSDYEEQTSEKEIEVADQSKRNYDKDKVAAQARRQAEKALQDAQAKQDAFAKNLGYESFDQLTEAQSKQVYLDEGATETMASKMYEMDQMMTKFKAQEKQIELTRQKAELKNESFFDELEPELDEMLKTNPDIPADVAFKYLRGEKLDELLAKVQTVSKQQAINNLNNKSHIKSEQGGLEIETVHIDEDEWNMYKALNRTASREEWVKFKKSIT